MKPAIEPVMRIRPSLRDLSRLYRSHSYRSVARLLEVLIKKRMTETPPRIGKQRCYGAAADFLMELVNARGRGEIHLDRFHYAALAPKLIRSTFQLRFIGGN